MSEHSRRNLVCASWHRAPEGWHSWGGNVSGWTERPFCDNTVGHPGDHTAVIYAIEDGMGNPKHLTWPNTLGMPGWLVDTTIHGLKMLAERETGLKSGRLGDVIEALEAQRKEATHG